MKSYSSASFDDQFFFFYNSVTAQSFIWQAKDSTPSRCESGPAPKERPQSVLLPLFIRFVFSPLSLLYAHWASQEGGVFVSPEVLTLVHGFSFVPLFHFQRLIPFFILSHCHFLLLFWSEVLIVMKGDLLIFFFMVNAFCVLSRRLWPLPSDWVVCPHLFCIGIAEINLFGWEGV